MPNDSVIAVGRRRRFGGLRPGVLRALWIAARHFFRNLGGSSDPDATLRYPEAKPARPDAFRGMPVLVEEEGGALRCVGCGICERVCPPRCIGIETAPAERKGAWPALRRFDIDMARCLLCGLCEESCPAEAIVMSPHFEIATFEREATRFTLAELRVPASLLGPRLDFLRSAHGSPPRDGTGAAP